jgi:hypothetical protein
VNISSRPKLSFWASDRFLNADCCSIIRAAMNATVQAIDQSKAQIPSTECLGSGLIVPVDWERWIGEERELRLARDARIAPFTVTLGPLFCRIRHPSFVPDRSFYLSKFDVRKERSAGLSGDGYKDWVGRCLTVLLSEYRVPRRSVPCQNLTMTQNLVKDLEHLAEHEVPTHFVSALDTYLQRYVKGNRDLDELTKHWDSGMMAERSPKKPGYIVKRRFMLSEAAERGRRVCGLEEMTQKGVLGKRQKRNPQCEQVGRLYQLAGAKWLSLRMKESKGDAASDKRDWDQWFQTEAKDAFKRLPEEAVSPASGESDSGASKRRKTAAADLEAEDVGSSLTRTADASSSGVVSTLASAADNTHAATDASTVNTTLSTAFSAERETVSTGTEIGSTDASTTRIAIETLQRSETTTSSRSEY